MDANRHSTFQGRRGTSTPGIASVRFDVLHDLPMDANQACRVVRYGTITICTVRTVLVKLQRTTVFVTPYFTVITVKKAEVRRISASLMQIGTRCSKCKALKHTRAIQT